MENSKQPSRLTVFGYGFLYAVTMFYAALLTLVAVMAVGMVLGANPFVFEHPLLESVQYIVAAVFFNCYAMLTRAKFREVKAMRRKEDEGSALGGIRRLMKKLMYLTAYCLAGVSLLVFLNADFLLKFKYQSEVGFWDFFSDRTIIMDFSEPIVFFSGVSMFMFGWLAKWLEEEDYKIDL